MASLTVDLQGEYAFYDQPDRWEPEFRARERSPLGLGQKIYSNHSRGRFRTTAEEDSVAAGSTVHLKIDGITPLAALAIVSGQLNGRPPEAFGRIIVPFEESLDALIAIPEDAEGGTYIFFGQQWEPYGKPAYEGGTLIYPSSVSTVQVRSRVDEEDLWNSFEPWPEEDAEKVRENIRRTRTKF